MRKVYNVILIDTATTVDDTLLAYIDAADDVIQVLTYEWTSLSRARAMAETLKAINHDDSRVHYLVNRADSKGGLPRDAMKDTLGRKADFEVVSDGILVLEANNRGEPFINVGQKAQITHDVESIAAALVHSIADQAAARVAEQTAARAAASAE
jgi:Flp pilus assembly CpaE family ATPase